jgi:hypothetical protein
MRTAISEQISLLRSAVPNCLVEGKIINGPAAMSILDEARNWGADLSVLGSHGRTGLERFLIGSVAERVAEHASCSVEVVKKKLINNGNQMTRKSTEAHDQSVLAMSSHKPKPAQAGAQCQYDGSTAFSATDVAAKCTCAPDVYANLCHCGTMSNPWTRHKIAAEDQTKQNPSLVAYIKLGDGRMSREDQLNIIQQYCLQHGFRLDDTFVESEGTSGRLQEALATMKDHAGLIAVDLDSFVQDRRDRIRDLRPFLHHFFCHGKKHLIAIEEGIDTGTAAGQVAALEMVTCNKDI